MDINNLMFSLLNIAVQNFEMNFESLFEMMPSEKPQSVSKKRSRKAFVHVTTFQMNFSNIKFIRLEALQMTVNRTSSFSDKTTMKFITMIRKKMNDATIDINSP